MLCHAVCSSACAASHLILPHRYAHGRFDLDNAKGPFRLDLGDVLYAPNVMRDDAGRVVMWGWLQEKRTVGVLLCVGTCRLLVLCVCVCCRGGVARVQA